MSLLVPNYIIDEALVAFTFIESIQYITCLLFICVVCGVHKLQAGDLILTELIIAFP